MADKDVIAPVVIRQEMPQLTPAMKPQAKDRGIVEVVIDELGRVTYVADPRSRCIRCTTRAADGRRASGAISRRRYAGKPVRYRKMIQINVNRKQ